LTATWYKALWADADAAVPLLASASSSTGIQEKKKEADREK
jgi:hypothetical protein